MFLVRRLLFLFLANEWAAVGVSSMDPTVNGLNLFTDPLVLKGSSRYIEGSMDPRVDMDDGFKTGQWTTSNVSEHVPS